VADLTSSLRVVLYRPLINTSAILMQLFFCYVLCSRSIVPRRKKNSDKIQQTWNEESWVRDRGLSEELGTG
jgi:hypothetical protein